MAANASAVVDQDGVFADWIELHNPDASPADLTGWYLTDSPKNKTKWQLPAISLPPGAYLLVFASGKNRRDPSAPLHTNFALKASGEYLALVKPDAVTIAFEINYPAQVTDVSFGLPKTPSGESAAPAFLEKPTPSQPNTRARAPAVGQTVLFSQAPGPFRNPFSLEMSGAGANQRIRYVITSSAKGASAPAPTAASTAYTGPIAIDASVVIRAAVFSDVDGSAGPVATVHYARLGANLGSFASQLPVLVIDSLGSGALVKDGIDHRSWSYLFTPRGNGSPVFGSAPEMTSPLTATVRGASSAEFPKKSYTIKFTDADGLGRSQPLLNLPAYEKWALIGPWQFDYSYVNNALVYALSNQMGRWAPRTRFVEVFFNSDGNEIDSADYAGIYALTDRIEIGKGRVDLKSLSATDVAGSAVTGGYILKIDVPDPDEIAWKTNGSTGDSRSSSIVLVHPKADAVAPAQLNYIRDYVQRLEAALLADKERSWSQRTYLDYLDRSSWVDHHLLNVFVCNPDAFLKSSYFTKDRDGKLLAGPLWDFDRSLGSYWDERSFRWDIWSGLGGVDFWRTGWWGIIAQDPEFMQEWIDRWQSLRLGHLSNPSLITLVETLGAQIGAEAVARDAARWPDNVSPYGSYSAQIARLKGWVTLRAQWIDDQFLRAPDATRAGGSLVFTAPAGAQLAYTLDGSDPRALGGEIAVNAKLTSSPLSVPAAANVHVRSYRAEWRGVFPGSPWSSAVGGDSSSPLSPRARLVNLSSRAAVGSGENALVAGVVVADTAGKRYLFRAIGPGLAAFGATDVLPDPRLGIFAGTGAELFRNSGWESGPDVSRLPGYAQSVGAFPLTAGSPDSALVTELKAGAYTLQITSPTARPGLVLTEMYELDAGGRSVNLSARARVSPGAGALIGGFVIQGPACKRMLLRAVGPTLAGFGLAEVLRDPVLTVYAGPEIVSTNDRWEAAENASALVAATRLAGAFNLGANSEDAALLITLPPGAYTVEVKGKDHAEGVALLEIYDLP